VLYAIVDNFQPPDPAGLLALSSGMHALPSIPGGLALDFVREQVNGKPMITLAQITFLPESERIGDHATPLENAVDILLNETITDNGTIFAFGRAYADSGQVDGIHDIHMNQGNPIGSFGKDNGIWQDGAIFIYLPLPEAGPPFSSPSRPNHGTPTALATRSAIPNLALRKLCAGG